MGPGPVGRSGHAMASSGTRVFVLGGEAFGVPRPEETNIIHVLDTSKVFFKILFGSFFSLFFYPRAYQIS